MAFKKSPVVSMGSMIAIHQNNVKLYSRIFTSNVTLSIRLWDEGLEAIAEDGNNDILSSVLMDKTGITQLLASGVWAVHTNVNPFFTDGETDYSEGLSINGRW